jgi:hypothetical protein
MTIEEVYRVLVDIELEQLLEEQAAEDEEEGE